MKAPPNSITPQKWEIGICCSDHWKPPSRHVDKGPQRLGIIYFLLHVYLLVCIIHTSILIGFRCPTAGGLLRAKSLNHRVFLPILVSKTSCIVDFVGRTLLKIDSGNATLPPALFLPMFLFAKVSPVGVLSWKVDFLWLPQHFGTYHMILCNLLSAHLNCILQVLPAKCLNCCWWCGKWL